MGANRTTDTPQIDAARTASAETEDSSAAILSGDPIDSMLVALSATNPPSTFSGINRWTVGMVALVCLLTGLVGGVLTVSFRGPNRFIQVMAPIQRIESPVCAGVRIEQENQIVVNVSGTVRVVITIYDSSGNVYYPVPPVIDLAVEGMRTIIAIFSWDVPVLPEGTYKRVVVATIQGGESVTSVTEFTTIDCSKL